MNNEEKSSKYPFVFDRIAFKNKKRTITVLLADGTRKIVYNIGDRFYCENKPIVEFGKHYYDFVDIKNEIMFYGKTNDWGVITFIGEIDYSTAYYVRYDVENRGIKYYLYEKDGALYVTSQPLESPFTYKHSNSDFNKIMEFRSDYSPCYAKTFFSSDLREECYAYHQFTTDGLESDEIEFITKEWFFNIEQ